VGGWFADPRHRQRLSRASESPPAAGRPASPGADLQGGILPDDAVGFVGEDRQRWHADALTRSRRTGRS
jgi:hypothetical protein